MDNLTDLSYHFEETSEGFRVWAAHRKTVEVRFNGRHWNFRVPDETREWFGTGSLLNYPMLVTSIAYMLTQEWKPKRYFPNARRWVVGRVGRIIARRLHPFWGAEVAKLPETRLRLLRAFHATMRTDHDMLWDNLFIRQHYIVSDLLRYRAARYALHCVRGTWLPETEAYIDAMEHWRDCFSDIGRSYPALNRTLDTLPGNIPVYPMQRLDRFHLERSIGDRLEFLVTAYGCSSNRSTRRINFNHTFQYARRNEIVHAMRIVARYNHWDSSPRRAHDIRDFVFFIHDYPSDHQGGIVGLAEKAVRWHRDRAEQRYAEERALLDDTTPTALPPIPLPDNANIHFLTTAGAVRNEGIAMQHCVGGYARAAINGSCYLFHVDYKGESATVEVTREGQVRQSYGYGDSICAASRYAARVLKKWGRGFPESIAAEPEWDEDVELDPADEFDQFDAAAHDGHILHYGM